MKNIRIGNDINVIWSIFDKEGNPYPLVKELKLTLKCGNYLYNVTDYTIEDNNITFVFYGKLQTTIGTYMLTLVENDDEVGMQTLDCCKAFKLVRTSCEETNDDTFNPQVDSLQLTSSLGLSFVGSNVPTENVIITTYAKLKQLLDASELVVGQKYRFPYTLHTNPDYEDIKSAGHVFDLIITAIAPDRFDENVIADYNEDDKYIEDGEIYYAWLNSLTIKYKFVNSYTDWADYEYGVITYMGDTQGNEFPYDVINLMYKAYRIYDIDGNMFVSFTPLDSDNFVWCYTLCVVPDNNDSSTSNAFVGSPELYYNVKVKPYYEPNRVIIYNNGDCQGVDILYSNRITLCGDTYDVKINQCSNLVCVGLDNVDVDSSNDCILIGCASFKCTQVDNSILSGVNNSDIMCGANIAIHICENVKLSNAFYEYLPHDEALLILLSDYGYSDYWIYESFFLDIIGPNIIHNCENINIGPHNDECVITDSYNIHIGSNNNLIKLDGCESINIKYYNKTIDLIRVSFCEFDISDVTIKTVDARGDVTNCKFYNSMFKAENDGGENYLFLDNNIFNGSNIYVEDVGNDTTFGISNCKFYQTSGTLNFDGNCLINITADGSDIGPYCVMADSADNCSVTLYKFDGTEMNENYFMQTVTDYYWLRIDGNVLTGVNKVNNELDVITL